MKRQRPDGSYEDKGPGRARPKGQSFSVRRDPMKGEADSKVSTPRRAVPKRPEA